MLKIMFLDDRGTLLEIRHSLSSKTIMWTPDVILIKHPNKDVHFVLKSRYMKDEDLLNLSED
jgi:hypothetical protein